MVKEFQHVCIVSTATVHYRWYLTSMHYIFSLSIEFVTFYGSMLFWKHLCKFGVVYSLGFNGLCCDYRNKFEIYFRLWILSKTCQYCFRRLKRYVFSFSSLSPTNCNGQGESLCRSITIKNISIYLVLDWSLYWTD